MGGARRGGGKGQTPLKHIPATTAESSVASTEASVVQVTLQVTATATTVTSASPSSSLPPGPRATSTVTSNTVTSTPVRMRWHPGPDTRTFTVKEVTRIQVHRGDSEDEDLQFLQADIADITSKGLAFIATSVTIATPAASSDLAGSQPALWLDNPFIEGSPPSDNYFGDCEPVTGLDQKKFSGSHRSPSRSRPQKAFRDTTPLGSCLGYEYSPISGSMVSRADENSLDGDIDGLDDDLPKDHPLRVSINATGLPTEDPPNLRYCIRNVGTKAKNLTLKRHLNAHLSKAHFAPDPPIEAAGPERKYKTQDWIQELQTIMKKLFMTKWQTPLSIIRIPLIEGPPPSEDYLFPTHCLKTFRRAPSSGQLSHAGHFSLCTAKSANSPERTDIRRAEKRAEKFISTDWRSLLSFSHAMLCCRQNTSCRHSFEQDSSLNLPRKRTRKAPTMPFSPNNSRPWRQSVLSNVHNYPFYFSNQARPPSSQSPRATQLTRSSPRPSTSRPSHPRERSPRNTSPLVTPLDYNPTSDDCFNDCERVKKSFENLSVGTSNWGNSTQQPTPRVSAQPPPGSAQPAVVNPFVWQPPLAPILGPGGNSMIGHSKTLAEDVINCRENVLPPSKSALLASLALALLSCKLDGKEGKKDADKLLGGYKSARLASLPLALLPYELDDKLLRGRDSDELRTHVSSRPNQESTRQCEARGWIGGYRTTVEKLFLTRVVHAQDAVVILPEGSPPSEDYFANCEQVKKCFVSYLSNHGRQQSRSPRSSQALPGSPGSSQCLCSNIQGGVRPYIDLTKRIIIRFAGQAERPGCWPRCGLGEHPSEDCKAKDTHCVHCVYLHCLQDGHVLSIGPVLLFIQGYPPFDNCFDYYFANCQVLGAA
jgi:hypothetical protein